MRRARVLATLTGVALLVSVMPGVVAADTTVATSNGVWTAHPGQSTTYQTTVQPINADGTSNFKASGKAVIPVKFSLSIGTGPLVFESVLSDALPDNDYSFASFTPSASVLFKDITRLSSTFTFTEGNCFGGSLRWSVRVSATQSVFIYYGDYPNFTDCRTSSQSGTNLIALSDLRFDTSQVGGTFYDSYLGAVSLVGDLPIVRASLVLDGGWGGDQRVALTSATFGANGYTDTFAPASSGAGTPTCALPTNATIKIAKTDGTSTGDVNEPLTIQPNDSNSTFRVVDCKLMYNLASGSLSGAGTYKVYAVIDDVPASNPAVFDLK
jgi:hypothetical protein